MCSLKALTSKIKKYKVEFDGFTKCLLPDTRAIVKKHYFAVKTLIAAIAAIFFPKIANLYRSLLA